MSLAVERGLTSPNSESVSSEQSRNFDDSVAANLLYVYGFLDSDGFARRISHLGDDGAIFTLATRQYKECLCTDNKTVRRIGLGLFQPRLSKKIQLFGEFRDTLRQTRDFPGTGIFVQNAF